MIVEAVGIAVTEDTDHARRSEAAMLAALKRAQAAGITDPNQLRELILKARDDHHRDQH